MDKGIVMGVDGGNTSCRVALATTDDQVLGYGKSGPASADGVDAETAACHIREAVDAAWRDAGRTPEPVSASFWGMAGVDSDDGCSTSENHRDAC